jgi:hypothetical protein
MSSPELQADKMDWEGDPEIIRLQLGSDSSLYSVLCAASGPNEPCTFPGKVVLNENLECDGVECNVDTLRTVRVQSLPDPIYYEYIRPACVEQAFFNDARRVKSFTQKNLVANSMMCADPRRDVAAESCCNDGWETSTNLRDHGFRFCVSPLF